VSEKISVVKIKMDCFKVKKIVSKLVESYIFMGLVENSEKCSDPRCYRTGEPPARPLAAVTRPIQHTFQSKCS
jgi:hypothetical protein